MERVLLRSCSPPWISKVRTDLTCMRGNEPKIGKKKLGELKGTIPRVHMLPEIVDDPDS